VEAFEEMGFLASVLDQWERGDLKGALAQAQARAASLTLSTTQPESVLWSIRAAHSENDVLFAAEARWGIEANTWAELSTNDAFINRLLMPVEVDVIAGWLGFIWHEIMCLLRDRCLLRRCKECGLLLVGGRRSRTYCRKAENSDCYRGRATDRQRARRAQE
jgi:hypothetical protein